MREFCYDEALDAEENEYDKNEKKRHQLLAGLQFDHQPSDERLVRYLLLQETKMHATAPMQGLSSSLQLNCHILSRYKNPKNVWLFVNAKNANFDTYCGLDYEYLVSAGITATYDYVAQTTTNRKDAFYTIAGISADNCHILPTELETWESNRQAQDKRLPKTIEEEVLFAKGLGEVAIFREKLFQWKASITTWTYEDVNLLNYFEEYLTYMEGKI